jgi:hypothetical protein
MSVVTGLDIRLPIGGLFTILGLILVGYGLATGSNTALYDRSLGININIWWGGAILLFGLMMVYLARRSGPSGMRRKVPVIVDKPVAPR